MNRFPCVGQVAKALLISMVLMGAGSAEAFGQPDSHTLDRNREIQTMQPDSSIQEPARISLPSTHAKAAALIDVQTGRLLFSHNGDAILPMASTTKIMTAIVAIEHGRLSDKVKTSGKAFAKEGSSIYLRLGEEMSLNHLLYGLMLRSGNDAAVAIAEHVGGSEEGFVYMMNEKARMLGLEHTQFRNPHGLDAAGHYTTANELAQLSAYALHNSTFRDIVRTQVKTAPNPHEKWDYKWTNKNKMLRLYEGADGVKTGYTSRALRCLVSSATRDGQQLVAVTLNDSNDWADHSRLLDYGFQAFPMTPLVQKGQRIEGSSLETSRGVAYPIGAGERERVAMAVSIPDGNSLDARLGHRGRLIVKLEDNVIATVPLTETKASAPAFSVPSDDGHAATPAGKWFIKLREVVGSLFGV
ncbi:D-alanyl-D-alanine carboxypeptidase family protein [Paenibacillus apiarius]|uniref:D-alanyl-D-alanine carboxypeptidase family protein n=1 Tax=Paenibacillus apiarius TaxID=46240 RepID=UPI003B3A0E09